MRAGGSRRSPTSQHGPERSVESRFRGALRRSPHLIPAGSSVLVAFSGGSDSTALLRLLCALREDRALDVVAAHYDHGLRPGSAAAARHAVSVCREVGVPCELGRAAGLSGGQARYREARYAYLESVADRLRVDRIALAHQRDDHRETVLLNLLRGTGLRGLAGIPVRRGRFVRPLLGFAREELRAYLAGGGHRWLEDPTNEDPRYLRARVRARLIPALSECADAPIAELLSRIADDARRADDGLDARATRLLSAAATREATGGAQIARSTVRAYDRADRARMLRKIARDMGFRLGRGGTAAGVSFMSDGRSGHGVDIAGGLRLTREYEHLRVGRVEHAPSDRELEIVAEGQGGDDVRLGGHDYRVRWGSLDGTEKWVTTLPRSALRFPLRLRGPRPGDRIRTRAGSRKLKKLLNERRVPASERRGVPVLVGADRAVLWVAGHSEMSFEPSRPEEEMFEIGVLER